MIGAEGFSPSRWKRIITDGQQFLQTWGRQAVHLGWNELELFGVHAVAPDRNYSASGLVLLIEGRTVTYLGPDHATLQSPTSASTLTYLRRNFDARWSTALWNLCAQDGEP